MDRYFRPAYPTPWDDDSAWKDSGNVVIGRPVNGDTAVFDTPGVYPTAAPSVGVTLSSCNVNDASGYFEAFANVHYGAFVLGSLVGANVVVLGTLSITWATVQKNGAASLTLTADVESAVNFTVIGGGIESQAIAVAAALTLHGVSVAMLAGPFPRGDNDVVLEAGTVLSAQSGTQIGNKVKVTTPLLTLSGGSTCRGWAEAGGVQSVVLEQGSSLGLPCPIRSTCDGVVDGVATSDTSGGAGTILELSGVPTSGAGTLEVQL
ncbi:MAG: hypothetical protein KA004_17395 [Verrucomicrobiales bacterium]|nr:hypothetical protein [Verrucomicrobiales bacterium]